MKCEPAGKLEQLDPDVLRLRALQSDPVAFESLYREYYPRLYEFIVRILGRVDDVEETINDTMMVVWTKAGDFRGRSKVSTWIFGIAYRKALKRLKSTKRVAERELQQDVDVADGHDPLEAVNYRRAIERVSAAVAKLPVAQRSIVHLSFFYGYSYGEIATIVGCPLNTVKTRMFYARERLRPMLDIVLAKERML